MLKPEIKPWVKAAYPKEYLDTVCKKLGITDLPKQEIFSKFLIDTGEQYLEFKRINPAKSRLKPHEQTDLLRKYSNTLQAVKNCYEEINADPSTTAKFHSALKDEYNTQTTYMQEMLRPYRDATGANIGAFFSLLDLLTKVCEAAENANIGTDKTKLSTNILTWWVSTLKQNWPKNSSINFGLGNYLKERGEYKSSSCDILFPLMHKIDSTIDRGNIESAMRIVLSKENINQHPAKFLLV